MRSEVAKICMFEGAIRRSSLQILTKQALELLKNLFKAIDFLVLLYQDKRTEKQDNP
jgi:hypothetical protein